MAHALLVAMSKRKSLDVLYLEPNLQSALAKRDDVAKKVVIASGR